MAQVSSMRELAEQLRSLSKVAVGGKVICMPHLSSYTFIRDSPHETHRGGMEMTLLARGPRKGGGLSGVRAQRCAAGGARARPHRRVAPPRIQFRSDLLRDLAPPSC